MPTQGTATVGTPTINPSDPTEVIVPLQGVTNVQRLAISLSGVHNSAGEVANNQVAQMGVLVGDVDGSGRVDSTDVFQTRQRSLQTANSSNFRADVDASGRVDSTDVFVTRQHSLTSLP